MNEEILLLLQKQEFKFQTITNMKRLKFIICLLILLSFSTSNCTEDNDSGSDYPCGFHNGKQLYTGPKGGCYYYNSSGNKTYVDRSECNCS